MPHQLTAALKNGTEEVCSALLNLFPPEAYLRGGDEWDRSAADGRKKLKNFVNLLIFGRFIIFHLCTLI